MPEENRLPLGLQGWRAKLKILETSQHQFGLPGLQMILFLVRQDYQVLLPYYFHFFA